MVSALPCQGDTTGDAKYEAGGTIGPNVPNLDITGSSVNIDPANRANLDVRMNIANLTALPSSGETGLNANDVYVDYLTSWVYHNPSGAQATYDSTGNVYYAYLEVNTVTGATTAFAGNTCSISTTHGKYLVYPGDVAVTSKIDKITGQIDVTVPLSDVGKPAVGSRLYSVTAHSVGQPGPAGGPGSCTRDPNGNNQDPTGQVFDVYDKSPAYTSILTTPVSLVITGTGKQVKHTVTFKWKLAGSPRPSGFNILDVAQNGAITRVNKSIISSHGGSAFTFKATRVKTDIDNFYVSAKTGSQFVSFGPFTVTG
jgi:hypothetical protein